MRLLLPVLLTLAFSLACSGATAPTPDAPAEEAAEEISEEVAEQVSDIIDRAQEQWPGRPSQESPALREGMRPVPGDCFQMGSASGDPDEKPVHRVCVTDFLLDAKEVTNADYLEFTTKAGASEPRNCCDPRFNVWDGTPYPPGQGDRPVVNVTWDEADAYCTWRGKRLPTEAEWELAARGGQQAARWPLGDEPPTPEQAVFGIEFSALPAAGSTPANGFGLHDMAGSVWEWVGDRYGADYYQHSPPKSPTGPLSDTCCVVRGGAWFSKTPEDLRVSNRFRMPSEPTVGLRSVGFRCALRSGEFVAPYPRGEVAAGRMRRGTNETYHYVDETGASVIPGPFYSAEKFSEDHKVAWVRYPGETWSLIDTAGTVLARQVGAEVADFRGGYARFQAEHYGPFGFVNPRGQVALAPSLTDAGHFSTEGVVPARDEDLWGLMRLDRTWAVQPRYQAMGEVTDGKVAVLTDTAKDTWHLIDLTGKQVAPGGPPPKGPATYVKPPPASRCESLFAYLAGAYGTSATYDLVQNSRDGELHSLWTISVHGPVQRVTSTGWEWGHTDIYLPGFRPEQARVIAEACSPIVKRVRDGECGDASCAREDTDTSFVWRITDVGEEKVTVSWDGDYPVITSAYGF